MAHLQSGSAFAWQRIAANHSVNARSSRRYEDIEDDQSFINAQLVRYSHIASPEHTLLGDDAPARTHREVRLWTWYDKKALITRTWEGRDSVCAAHRLRPELT